MPREKPVDRRLSDENTNENEELLRSNWPGYEKRKVTGLCCYFGCTDRSEFGHRHCRKHLDKMLKDQKGRVEARKRGGLCINCGKRPKFWGVRCIICRQFTARDPLPHAARRALRLYREAATQLQNEETEVQARFAIRRMLATKQIEGKGAEALSLYAGLDGGQWRSYREVAKLMNLSKERIRQLLQPSKVALVNILGDKLPWKSGHRRSGRDSND